MQYIVFEVQQHPTQQSGWNYTGRKLKLPENFPMDLVFGAPMMEKIRQSGSVAIASDLFQQLEEIINEQNTRESAAEKDSIG